MHSIQAAFEKNISFSVLRPNMFARLSKLISDVVSFGVLPYILGKSKYIVINLHD